MSRRRIGVIDEVVEFRAPDALAALVAAVYADAPACDATATLTVQISTVAAGHQVRIDAQKVGLAAGAGALYELVQQELTYALLARLRSRYLLLHAGGVCLGPATWILPGYHASGKTSLALALARQGAFLADDVIAVDPVSLGTRPFPRDLVLHSGTRRALPWLPAPAGFARFADYDYLPASAAGLPPGRGAPVTGIVFPRRARRRHARLLAVGAAETARRLLEQCFDLQGLGAASIDVIARLARRPAVEVHFDDAATAVPLLRAWPASTAPPSGSRRAPSAARI